MSGRLVQEINVCTVGIKRNHTRKSPDRFLLKVRNMDLFLCTLMYNTIIRREMTTPEEH